MNAKYADYVVGNEDGTHLEHVGVVSTTLLTSRKKDAINAERRVLIRSNIHVPRR